MKKITYIIAIVLSVVAVLVVCNLRVTAGKNSADLRTEAQDLIDRASAANATLQLAEITTWINNAQSEVESVPKEGQRISLWHLVTRYENLREQLPDWNSDVKDNFEPSAQFPMAKNYFHQ